VVGSTRGEIVTRPEQLGAVVTNVAGRVDSSRDLSQPLVALRGRDGSGSDEEVSEGLVSQRQHQGCGLGELVSLGTAHSLRLGAPRVSLASTLW